METIMRNTRFLVAITLLPALPGLAQADETTPPDGTCLVAQGAMTCSTKGGAGSFDIPIYFDIPLKIELEDGISGVVPPPADLFDFEAQEKVIVIVAKTTKLPERTAIIITTDYVTATINLVPSKSSKGAQTVLRIRDPRWPARQEAFDKYKAELQADYEAKLAELETKADARAEAILLAELASAGIDTIDPDTSRARNDRNIVIWANSVVRIGGRRYLLLTVHNRSADDFHIAGVELWAKTGKDERELTPSWNASSKDIAVDAEATIAVRVPFKKDPSAKTRLRVRVLESNEDRAVELSGIKVK